MILISHRGNTTGRNLDRENDPLYIDEALRLGYDVELDVWFGDGVFYLGHDEPTYPVSSEYLKNHKLWCHAKNIKALNELVKQGMHCFWHQEDDVTLTSKGYMWTYPGKELTKKSIAVKPDRGADLGDISGVCSDYIKEYND
jgi:hypothetical protein